MYGQSTSGSTQPGERPVTARSGDVSSTRQNSIMGHATGEEEEELKSEEIISHSKIMLAFHSTLCLKKDPRHF